MVFSGDLSSYNYVISEWDSLLAIFHLHHTFCMDTRSHAMKSHGKVKSHGKLGMLPNTFMLSKEGKRCFTRICAAFYKWPKCPSNYKQHNCYRKVFRWVRSSECYHESEHRWPRHLQQHYSQNRSALTARDQESVLTQGAGSREISKNVWEEHRRINYLKKPASWGK